MTKIEFKSIGTIYSPYEKSDATPIQASVSDKNGVVEIFPEYKDGLKDLDGFSHIILLYHFHQSKNFSLQVKPYLDKAKRGLFSTRAPSRPNPIGISIVKLLRIEGTKLYIQNIDIFNGTPLLDIKPFVPNFDLQEEYQIGWLEKHIHKLNKTKDDGRFSS